jgi:DNA mismatch endonuclease (patch repair protein)
MSRIKSSNTKPELLIRKFLFANGLRYRTNVKSLPGSPDIKLTKYKCLVFVNGCFWHGHSCRKNGSPKTNATFWSEKIKKNQKRDIDNFDRLNKLGWKVIVIWECELTKSKKEQILQCLLLNITSNVYLKK